MSEGVKAKPWQIGVIVLAIVAIGGSLAWSMTRGRKVDLSDRLTMVDVATGDVFKIPVKKGLAIPAENPKTGKRSLLPAYDEGGRWYINERYLALIEECEGDAAAVLDAESGEVRVSN